MQAGLADQRRGVHPQVKPLGHRVAYIGAFTDHRVYRVGLEYREIETVTFHDIHIIGKNRSVQ